MNKIIISIRAAVVCVINAVVVYTCCIAAGDADDAAEEFWMYKCAIDSSGKKYGWGRVLDHIGVQWRNPDTVLDRSEQMTLF